MHHSLMCVSVYHIVEKKNTLSHFLQAKYDVHLEGTGIEPRRDLGTNVSFPPCGGTGI